MPELPRSAPSATGAADPPGPPSGQARRWVSIGVGLTILQLTFALVTETKALDKLCQWDCGWYRSIVTEGYQSPWPPRAQTHESNVGFFPGYPAAAWVVSRIPGLPVERALVWTAVLGAGIAWTYWAALLGWMRGPGLGGAVPTMVAVAFPGSFFLMAGYSESLFQAALLGFVFWTERALARPAGFPAAWLLAVAHGIVLTGTRFVGIAALVYPLLRWWALEDYRPRFNPRLLWMAGLAMLSAGGLLGFLAYCQWKFGHWNLYFETVRIGWYSHPGQSAPSYLRDAIDLSFSGSRPDGTGRLFTWIAALAAGGGLWMAVRRQTGERLAVPLLATALCLIGITVVGRAALGFVGMVRYLLPPMALLVLAYSLPGRVSLPWLTPRSPEQERWMLWILAALLMALQIAMLRRFMQGQWVA